MDDLLIFPLSEVQRIRVQVGEIHGCRIMKPELQSLCDDGRWRVSDPRIALPPDLIMVVSQLVDEALEQRGDRAPGLLS